MRVFFARLPEGTNLFILKIAIVTGVIIVVAFVFFVLKRKIKRSNAKLKKLKAEVEKHEIDTLRTGLFTRSDLHFWIKSNMKKGNHCVLMTGKVAKNKDYDLSLPSANGGHLLCLCIYQPGKQKVIMRQFIVADSIEPELDSMISENNGSIDFEY